MSKPIARLMPNVKSITFLKDTKTIGVIKREGNKTVAIGDIETRHCDAYRISYTDGTGEDVTPAKN